MLSELSVRVVRYNFLQLMITIKTDVFLKPGVFSAPPPLEVFFLLVLFFVHFPALELTCGHPIHMAGFQVVPSPIG